MFWQVLIVALLVIILVVSMWENLMRMLSSVVPSVRIRYLRRLIAEMTYASQPGGSRAEEYYARRRMRDYSFLEEVAKRYPDTLLVVKDDLETLLRNQLRRIGSHHEARAFLERQGWGHILKEFDGKLEKQRAARRE